MEVGIKIKIMCNCFKCTYSRYTAIPHSHHNNVKIGKKFYHILFPNVPSSFKKIKIRLIDTEIITRGYITPYTFQTIYYNVKICDHILKFLKVAKEDFMDGIIKKYYMNTMIGACYRNVPDEDEICRFEWMLRRTGFNRIVV